MLKVFEAFAGYGSQRMALKRCNIPHEIVGISEIDGDVILSYAAIHENLLVLRKKSIYPSNDEMRNYLKTINVPLNYKTFQNRADSLCGQKLKDMYLANKISKNFGDIRLIIPESLPDFDFFTYSFPCQDISVAGYQNGLSPNSGTRSSLLWKCCKIIETKKPKYLMMENVKNLVGNNHKKNFDKFLDYLETLGYTNFWNILNARDYGIPQNRERIFCLSILGDKANFCFPHKIPLKIKMNDLLEKDVSKNFYLNHNQVTDKPIEQEWIYCLDSNYWKGTVLADFQNKHRRQVVSCPKDENGFYPARRLTPHETWRFMDVSNEDFYKASQLVSNTSLYKQAGNSIVVSVLKAIFSNLFKEDVKNGTEVTGRNIRHDGRVIY